MGHAERPGRQLFQQGRVPARHAPLIAAAKGAGVRVVYAFATPYAWRDEVERFAEVVDSRELLEIWGGPAGSG